MSVRSKALNGKYGFICGETANGRFEVEIVDCRTNNRLHPEDPAPCVNLKPENVTALPKKEFDDCGYSLSELYLIGKDSSPEMKHFDKY